MKVIDLLNKIANGEVVPEKIKFDYQEYEYNDLAKTYYCGMNTLLSNYKFVILNDEIEILEEEKKIPEKVDRTKCVDFADTLEKTLNTLDSLIDYLQSKGDE